MAGQSDSCIVFVLDLRLWQQNDNDTVELRAIFQLQYLSDRHSVRSILLSPCSITPF
jgi:hypothetical protein